MRVTYVSTTTGHLMRQIALEYDAAIHGKAGSGFAYWLFLPVTVLLILTTVMLGYHYIVDAPAGALLALGVYYAEFRSPLIDRSGPRRSAS